MPNTLILEIHVDGSMATTTTILAVANTTTKGPTQHEVANSEMGATTAAPVPEPSKSLTLLANIMSTITF